MYHIKIIIKTFIKNHRSTLKHLICISFVLHIYYILIPYIWHMYWDSFDKNNSEKKYFL